MKVDSTVGNALQKKEHETALRDLILKNRPRVVFDLAWMALSEILNTPSLARQRWRMKSKEQRAIGYIGWIGHENLGDEAVFEAIRDSLRVDESLIPFIAAEGESLLARFGLGGTAVFRSVLLGGGTLIHPYYLPVARLAQKFGIPLYTVGTGVGSPGFFTPERPSLSGWKEILQNCELVSVRGPMSLARLQELGVAHAEIIGDPALGLAPDAPPAYRTRQRLIISLAQEERAAPGSSEFIMFRHVGKIANDFVGKGGEVIGVALGPKDRAALERFKRDHGVGGLRIEDHRTSTRDFFQTISGSIGLIGVRLHSAVLASCVGVPPILFAYRDKCKDFMSSMDLGDFAVEVSQEHGPRHLDECYDRLQSQADLGPAVYEKAIYWKKKQHAFYERLATSIAEHQRV